MECNQCVRILSTIGDAFNSPIETPVLLERAARAITEQLELRGCIFRLLTRDRKELEDVTSYGVSERFLNKGPVDAELSMKDALGGEIVWVEDCATDPRIQYPAAHAAEGIVSCLTVPLRARGQVLGTMRLVTGERREFPPDERQIAGIVASFATRAITHCMFQKTLQRVTDSVRTNLDPEEVLPRIAEVISDELRAKGATVHLMEPGGPVPVLRAHSGLSQRYLDRVVSDVVAAVWPRLEGGCCVQITEPEDEALLIDAAAVRRERVASQLFIPLIVRRERIGVIGIYTHLPYVFSDDELYFMGAVGDQCALAIQNARMYDALDHQYHRLMDDFQTWFERPYPHAHT